MKPVIIDCDPGHDDAIALLLAIAHPEVDLRLVSVVSGNHMLEKTLFNARRVVSLTGATPEIAPGCDRPLVRENEPAVTVHGMSGLDGPFLPEPTVPVSPRSALTAQAAVLTDSPTPTTILATGPLTNIALLLKTHPELSGKIERIVLMGGACFGGNRLPNAEYNIFIDPEAAAIVFDSGVPITMCGLDVTLRAQIFPREFTRFREIGNVAGKLVADLLDFYHQSTTPPFLAPPGHTEGAHLHDVCTVAYLINPHLFTTKDLYVQVETEGRLTRGCTVVDYDNIWKQPSNATVCFDIRRKEFIELLYEQITRLP